MKVEFIIATEDGYRSWDTSVIEVPDEVTEGVEFTSPEWDARVIAWAHDELMPQTQYRNTVYWGIYNSEPEADVVHELVIKHDEDPVSPRENECNLGTMVCWHGRHKLGDVRPTERPEDWFKENFPPEDLDGGMCLPLYLLDHSGITMSTENFNDQWDSGQVGWIVAKPEKVKEAFGDNSDESVQQARKNLIEEVNIYDQYLRGSSWVYKYGDDAWCGGFFGDSLEETGLKDFVPDEAKDQLEDAWEARLEQ